MTDGTKLYAWFEVDKRERERERRGRPIVRKERIINANGAEGNRVFFGRRWEGSDVKDEEMIL